MFHVDALGFPQVEAHIVTCCLYFPIGLRIKWQRAIWTWGYFGWLWIVFVWPWHQSDYESSSVGYHMISDAASRMSLQASGVRSSLKLPEGCCFKYGGSADSCGLRCLPCFCRIRHVFLNCILSSHLFQCIQPHLTKLAFCLAAWRRPRAAIELRLAQCKADTKNSSSFQRNRSNTKAFPLAQAAVEKLMRMPNKLKRMPNTWAKANKACSRRKQVYNPILFISLILDILNLMIIFQHCVMVSLRFIHI